MSASQPAGQTLSPQARTALRELSASVEAALVCLMQYEAQTAAERATVAPDTPGAQGHRVDMVEE